jgi:hypothetical protein
LGIVRCQLKINRRREQLLSEIEVKLQQKISQQLFAIRWQVRQ